MNPIIENLNWLDKTVSLYNTHADNIGKPATYRDILLCQFAKDLPAIIAIRKLDRFAPDYKIKSKPFKAKLQCYTPAALFESKATGNVIELHRTGVLQLDFDWDSISMYDLEDLKACVFSLPFIGFCGLSCSGFGFYALALIAEPEKLSEYAEHCFEIFKSYGIKPDESKGKKPESLRYLSYDANMLIRENPTPLLISHFKPQQQYNSRYTNKVYTSSNRSISAAVTAGLRSLQFVISGQRFNTVQKVSYSLGGLNEPGLIDKIIETILNNSSFAKEEEEFIKCAEKCFKEGMKKPFNN